MTTETEATIQTPLAPAYTRSEERFHSITHGIGAALSIAGLGLLLILAVTHGTSHHVVSFSIYGASLVLLYTASTLYHSTRTPQAKRLFRVLDHAAIYLLISGTYTPFLLIPSEGRGGRVLLIVIWGLALIGVSFKFAFMHRFQGLSLLTYLLMGWLSVGALRQLVTHLSLTGVSWLIAGGVLYTVGVIFYSSKRIRYGHAIWHLFVLGGSTCHYLAVLFTLTPLS